MPRKNKVSVSTAPVRYRLSSNERRAARLDEIANKQSELKREAAERRAKREQEGGDNAPAASGRRKAASVRRSDPR